MTNNRERAKAVIDRRRETAEQTAEDRRLALEEVSPELKEIDAQIAGAGLRALKAIGLGKDAQRSIAALAEENLANQKKRKEILESLGVDPDCLEVHYTCSKCNDTGVVNGHSCSCFKALVRQYQYERLNACSPAELSTFEDFRLDYYRGVTDETTGRDAYECMSQIFRYCKAYAEDFTRKSPNVIMCGRTGLGKTHLSLAIANVVIGKGYDVIYGSAHNLLGQLEREHFGKLQDDSSPEDAILGCDLLIIDDLGAEFSTRFTVSEIYNILNTRILTGLPTIISTNLMFDELADQYSDRVYSRIIGSYVPLEFIGHDVRQLRS